MYRTTRTLSDGGQRRPLAAARARAHRGGRRASTRETVGRGAGVSADCAARATRPVQRGAAAGCAPPPCAVARWRCSAGLRERRDARGLDTRARSVGPPRPPRSRSSRLRELESVSLRRPLLEAFTLR
eukprot:482922-Prymnesium_polylepis.2